MSEPQRVASESDRGGGWLPLLLVAGAVYVVTAGGVPKFLPSAWQPQPPVSGEAALADQLWQSVRPQVDGGAVSRDQARTDLRRLGALFVALADQLEFDGRAEQPVIKTGAQLQSTRIHARHLFFRGEQLGTRYPQLGPALGKVLDERAGTDGRTLTPEARAKWVAAYRALGDAAKQAGG